jgi:hypothetical protein
MNSIDEDLAGMNEPRNAAVKLIGGGTVMAGRRMVMQAIE